MVLHVATVLTTGVSMLDEGGPTCAAEPGAIAPLNCIAPPSGAGMHDDIELPGAEKPIGRLIRHRRLACTGPRSRGCCWLPIITFIGNAVWRDTEGKPAVVASIEAACPFLSRPGPSRNSIGCGWPSDKWPPADSLAALRCIYSGMMERAAGIEPASPGWKPRALPVDQARSERSCLSSARRSRASAAKLSIAAIR